MNEIECSLLRMIENDLLMLIKIPLCKILPETFGIKPLSLLGRFRRESDMRGLTVLLLLQACVLAQSDHSYQDQREAWLTKLSGPQLRAAAATKTKRVRGYFYVGGKVNIYFKSGYSGYL